LSIIVLASGRLGPNLPTAAWRLSLFRSLDVVPHLGGIDADISFEGFVERHVDVKALVIFAFCHSGKLRVQ
jgi:hypothetical protein